MHKSCTALTFRCDSILKKTISKVPNLHPWEVHNLLKVWVYASYIGGFWAQNSLSKGQGYFFGRFSLNMGVVAAICRKTLKMCSFPLKFIKRVGTKGKF